VNHGLNQDFTGEGFAVVIPTRNRPALLFGLIRNIEKASLKPRIVVIVDSSADSSFREISSNVLTITTRRTQIQSAAQQRNIGIEIVREQANELNVSFISFLDDDVRIPENYFDEFKKTFDSDSSIVGVSGFAKTEDQVIQRRSSIKDFLGITGAPGTLTHAAVNISPYGINSSQEVEWLIGCAAWRIEGIYSLRFESDFVEHSLYEDVIFSCRARKNGKLLFMPNLELLHSLESRNEEKVKSHYRNWVTNRYRIFNYSIPNVSKAKFWVLILFSVLDALIRAGSNYRQRQRLLGLVEGVFITIKKMIMK
jgi:glycosyltransferase involved in cell wall biosynthesis